MAEKISYAELRVISFLKWLPLWLVKSLAGSLAWLASWLPLSVVGAHRDVLLNMLICYPERSWRENRRAARRAMVQTARTLASYSHVWLRPETEALARVRTVHGYQDVSDAMHSERPVVILSLHQAAWEVPVLVIGQIAPAVIMYQPAEKNAVDPVVKHARERTGCQLVPADTRGVRVAMQALAHGGTFGILADHQPGGRSNPSANFFGYPVLVPGFVAKVIQRFKPDVFYVYATYLENDSRYDVHFDRADWAAGELDEAAILQHMMDGLEDIIRANPDDYNWTYNRFRRGADYQRNWYRKAQALDLIRRIRGGEPHASVFPVSAGVSKR